RKLAGWTGATPLTVTIPPEQKAEGSAELTHIVPEQTTEALRRCADEFGVPFHTVFLGSWALLLQRYSAEERVVFGLIKSCVEHEDRPDELVPHIVPATATFRDDATVRSWFRALADQTREAAPYEFISLPHIRVAAGIPENSPLFESVLSIGNEMFEPLSITRDAAVATENKYSLVVAVECGFQTLLRAAFSTRVFSADAISLMLGHWSTLLAALVGAPEQPLSALPMVTAEERDQLVIDWNNTLAEYPDSLCVHQLVEAQVERTPDATALLFGNRALSYREMNARANLLADQLRDQGAGPDCVVGICMERSIEAVLAVIAVLKSGAAYLPLDPSYPHERLQFMLADARALILLTQPKLHGVFATLPAHVIDLNENWFAQTHGETANPSSLTTPENLAYLIYTSGSTGKPKGVAMIHRALTNLIDWQNKNSSVAVGTRTLQFTSLSFDVSFQELFSTWASGGTLVLIDAELRLSPRDLWNFIARENVVRIFLPFVALQQLAEAAANEGTIASELREVITAGEQLQITPKLRELFTRHPEAALHNHYGPSETHVVTALTLEGDPQDWPALPSIGRPIQNTTIYLLDKHLAPTPMGIPGELHIGGTALARGYFERPDVTAERFIESPFETGGRLYRTGDLARYLPDGQIEFLGRIDHQVKIRGYRVELGEVESALSRISNVRECVVVARDRAGSKQLVAYVVPETEVTLQAQIIRHELKQHLPDYMVPGAFVFLDKLPLTPSGKVDRRALPAPDETQTTAAPAATGETPWLPIQLQLVQIWEELLSVRPIGIRDNFFELGGHSLLAVRMMDRVEELTGKKLPMTELFHDATIAHLSELILQSKESSASPVIELQSEGSGAPVYFLHGDIIGGGFYARDLAKLLGNEHPFYVLPPSPMQNATLTSVEEMTDLHLRDLRAHRPHGPYVLGGFCIGALVAYEMAVRLAADGEQVPGLLLIDPQLPSRLLRSHYNMVQKLGIRRGYSDEQKLALFARGHKVLFRLREEWNAPLRDKARFAARATRKLLHRHQPANSASAAVVDEGTPDLFHDDEQRILAGFHWILSGYTPPLYSGSISMFVTDEQRVLTPFLERRWQSIVPQIRIERLAGKHLDSITTNIDVLAGKVREHLSVEGVA
ncbi:MAG TPA: amino acid adenylation domain-containing protein, partial [Candidatus Acidoferrum sp.]|nr:amino acid adenylation domain-containing protein [Candidatus Acidoferrum sp.]